MSADGVEQVKPDKPRRKRSKAAAAGAPAESLFPAPADAPSAAAGAEDGAAVTAAPAHPVPHVPAAEPERPAEPPDESRLGELLLKFIRKRKTALFANLFKTCADDEEVDVVEAIHDVRVASRRLTEPLLLLAPDLPAGEADKIRKALRRVRRAFQVVRDLDVMSAAISEARGKPKGEAVSPQARALALIHEQMVRERETAFAAALSAAHDRETFKLKSRLDRLEPAVGFPAAGPVIDGRAVAARADALVADRIAGLNKEVVALPTDAGDPHQVRIAAKRLRYALELADGLGRPIGKDVLSRLKAVQEVLGTWHDEFVLAQELTRCCFANRALMREPELSSAVLRIAGRRLQLAAEELAKFSELWPALQDALTKTDGTDAQKA